MNPPPVKTRFAPSPTGRLHLGNARTALFNWLWARHERGVFVLRIEDTDAARGDERDQEALRTDLRWLGLAWDEGPEVEGSAAPYVQSARAHIYRDYFARLESGGAAYPCFCSERELELERKAQRSARRPPRYSGKCRALPPEEAAARLARGERATLRFRVPEARVIEFQDRVRGPQRFAAADIGDFVVRRSDGTPAFFFSNAVDDALMGVTLVLRGEDHLANTPRQILLLEALGLRVPDYAHIPLVVDADGAPLSKRGGSRALEELRAEGWLPEAIVNYLARLGHTCDETRLLALAELAERFSLERVHRSPARFDPRQLRYWQAEAVRAASAERLWAWFGAEVRAQVPADARAAFVDAVRDNVAFPADALHWARIVYAETPALSPEARRVVDAAGRPFFARVHEALAGLAAPDFGELAARAGVLTGARGKALFQPLRAALTGELHGPEMAKLLPLIGLERARRRIAARAGDGEK